MKIGVFETVPVLLEKLKAQRISFPFGGKLILERAVKGGVYDLVLSDRPHAPDPMPFSAQLYLFPHHARLGNPPAKGQVLLGGMSTWDDLGFSSIGEDEAFLCLQREIIFFGKSIMPFEKKIPLDRNFDLYKNMASGLTFALAQMIFAEES